MNPLALRNALADRVDRYLVGAWTTRQLEAWVVNAYEEFNDDADPELAELLLDASLRLAEAARDKRLTPSVTAWLGARRASLISGEQRSGASTGPASFAS